jgi:hypothetical protein
VLTAASTIHDATVGLVTVIATGIIAFTASITLRYVPHAISRKKP